MVIRRGGRQDVRFLRDMLHHAYYWRERNPTDGPGPAARYIKGWGRPGDTVLIAIDDEGLVTIGDIAKRETVALAKGPKDGIYGLVLSPAGNRYAILGMEGTLLVQDFAGKEVKSFALPSQPGSLFRALSVFALRNIDLSKLESRPIRGRAWEYMFYADLAVSRDDINCGRALVNLAEFARWVRTLGTYRAARDVSEPAEPNETAQGSGR